MERGVYSLMDGRSRELEGRRRELIPLKLRDGGESWRKELERGME